MRLRQLERLRINRGWTQRDLAARSGVAAPTISRLESGLQRPHPSTLRKLANALGIEPVDLIEWDSEPNQGNKPTFAAIG